MKIDHQPERCRFTAFDENDERMGEIGYLEQNGKLVATHTRVNEQFRGKGVAGGLLDALAEHAAAAGKKIVPECSYVATAFERNPRKYHAVIDFD